MSRARNLATLGNKNVIAGISTSTRVGIGSTIPDTKLDVDGTVTATSFSGDGSALTGTGQTANVGTSNLFVVGVSTFGAGVAGTIRANGDTTLAGVVTATGFVGALTGNVTGNCSGTSGSATGNAGGLTGTPDITVGNISAAGGDLTIRNVTGVAATFTGVLTYEDVTNVDSVGIVTARGGIKVGPLTGVGVTIGIDNAGDAIFAGIVTAGTCFKAGSVSGGAFGAGVGVTITGDGNAVFAGIVTATTLKYGSTSVETAIDAKASTGKAIAMAMVFGF